MGNIAVPEPIDTTKDFLSSEFTIQLTCVKLLHSPPENFEFCVNYLLQEFNGIYKCFQLEYLDKNKILRRFVTFFTTFV